MAEYKEFYVALQQTLEAILKSIHCTQLANRHLPIVCIAQH